MERRWALVLAAAAFGTACVDARSTVTLAGRQYETEQLHDTFGVRVKDCPVRDLLREDAKELCSGLRSALLHHKMVVFGDQDDMTPEEHVAICRELGEGGDCLDEKFTSNHNDGLEEEESGHYWEHKQDRQDDALRPKADAYAQLPPAVWPISNDPSHGTVNAGDGGFHCDGAWFGEHFRYMSFFCRSQFTKGGGQTFFASANSLLQKLTPEELRFLSGCLIEYTDKMVYPGGNSINPSGGRMTVIPLISILTEVPEEHKHGRGDRPIDPALTLNAFLDPKYWRRVYNCEAARDTSPAARERLMSEPFWDAVVGDETPERRAGQSAYEISGGVLEELPWEQASAILDGINQKLEPSSDVGADVTLLMGWRKNDLGFYCNRALLHRASPSTQQREPGELRLMHRISVRGPHTPPFFIQEPPEVRCPGADTNYNNECTEGQVDMPRPAVA